MFFFCQAGSAATRAWASWRASVRNRRRDQFGDSQSRQAVLAGAKKLARATEPEIGLGRFESVGRIDKGLRRSIIRAFPDCRTRSRSREIFPGSIRPRS